MQNLVVNGYTFPVSRHRLFHFGPESRPRELVATLVPHVPSAQNWQDAKPEHAVHIALSAGGLRSLDMLSPAAVESFSDVFLQPLNLKQLRETPGRAFWNGQPPENLHLLVGCWSASEAEDARMRELITTAAAACGVEEVYVNEQQSELAGQLLNGSARLHFGFVDGITAAPTFQWTDPQPTPPGERDLRHVLVGHGRSAQYAGDSTPNLVSATEKNRAAREEAVAFALNGSYLAFTLIRQHAGEFAKYLREKARELLPPDAPEAEIAEKIEWLAAKFMGRWRDGTPITQARSVAERPAAPNLANNFDFSDDAEGYGCPHAAHIRMANPRSQAIESFKSPTPVLIRRGMPYGPELIGEEEDGVDRGLIGMFICADLQDQYLKLVRWINRSDFSPAFGHRIKDEDPIAGNRFADSSREFRIPTPDGDVVLKSLPHFTTTLGTAFFFLPSMETLGRIAGTGI